MIIFIIIIVCLALLIIRSSFEVNSFSTSNFTFTSKVLTKDYKFVVLTDLHNRTYGVHNNHLIGAIDAIAPDKVFLIGDMINRNDDSIENALPLLEHLAKCYQVFYVNGNHEQRLKHESNIFYHKYIRKLEKLGIIFIENSVLSIDNCLNIYGLDLELEYYQRYHKLKLEKDYISSRLGKIDTQKYNILLTHNPNYFEHYEKWGADLVICGHNHGGVMILPFIGGILTPQGFLFPKYYAGLYQKNRTKLLVSRGIGSHTYNIRVFNRPEIMVVNLRKFN